MAGDVTVLAGVVISSFLFGALFALIAVVAAEIKLEDKTTMARSDRRLMLRGKAPGPIGAVVRRVNGFGERMPHGHSGRDRER